MQNLLAEEKEKYERLLSQKQSEISSIREEWQEEAYRLEKENDQLKENKKDLLERISHLEITTGMRSAVGDPWEHKVYLKNQEIYELEKKIATMRNQTRFITDSSTLKSGLSRDAASAVKNAMEVLQAELESILHGHNTSIPLRLPPMMKLNELSVLIRSVHSSGDAEELEMTLLRRWVSKFEPAWLLRYLCLQLCVNGFSRLHFLILLRKARR